LLAAVGVVVVFMVAAAEAVVVSVLLQASL
jgi:hypothetical protein